MCAHVCVCVDVQACRDPCMRLCVCLFAERNIYTHTHISGLSCSFVPLHLSLYSFSISGWYEIRGLLIWLLIEFWHKCLRRGESFFHNNFRLQCKWQLCWQSLSPSYLPTEPEKTIGLKNWSTGMSALHEYKTHYFGRPAWHWMAHNYRVYVPFCVFTVRSEMVCQFGLNF